MTAHLKSAAITVGIVLVGIYVLRKLPVGSTIVDMAFNG